MMVMMMSTMKMMIMWICLVSLIVKVIAVRKVLWDELVVESADSMNILPEASTSSQTEVNNKFVLDISGLDLSQNHDYATLELLKQTVTQYGVVILRNQSVEKLTVPLFRNVGLFFGQLQIHRENYSWHPDYADVNYISNMKDAQGRPIGLSGGDVEQFHSDLAWSLAPTTFTMLLGLILPSEQGKTLFSDSASAFESLDKITQEKILNLRGVYSYWKHHVAPVDVNNSSDPLMPVDSVVHPLVYTHPTTGRRSIYASAADTTKILDVSDEESEDLLNRLIDAVADDRFRYEHEWMPGDMVIWDNRVTQHKSGGCPANLPRKMLRLTIIEPNIDPSIAF